MTLHPLTPALLASMAMRSNHAMFMPMGLEDGMIGIAPWHERIPEGLRRAYDAYRLAEAGQLADVQILEEVDGRGFYSPDGEEYYLSALGSFPGMLELAERIVAGMEFRPH